MIISRMQALLLMMALASIWLAIWTAISVHDISADFLSELQANLGAEHPSVVNLASESSKNIFAVCVISAAGAASMSAGAIMMFLTRR
ncbi:MAG: hypothetical protein K2Z25_26045 [Beijerinckiaceae bacterium]|nr:hypothetical protein [Beijerinckiaceae bacterium]